MQAKQENGISMISRVENRKQFRQERQFRRGIVCTVLAYGLVDSEKKILLTKRSSQKRYAPGKWENTGGHMISGETSKHAIVRELREETGIQIDEEELIALGDNHIGQFLGDNYAVFKDVSLEDVRLEEGETEDVIKVTLPQLEQMAERKMLSPAVWDHMAGYKDEFYRLFD